MISQGHIAWIVFAVIISAITIVDMLTYRIPNAAVAALAVIGAVLIALAAPGAIISHLVSAAAALVVGFGLYKFTGFGAGDAKFFAAIMIWFGVAGLIPLLFWFGLACAVLVVILALGRRLPLNPDSGLGAWRPLQKGAPVPLALAIGPAALIASTQFSNGLW